MYPLLFLTVALAASSALAQTDEAPFSWDENFASPGTSLSIEMLETVSGPPKGMVIINVSSVGFAESPESLLMWQKMGGKYYRLKPGITADGKIQIVPGTDKSMLGNYIRGQSFDIAVVDAASGKRAHAKLTPFPVSVQSEAGCGMDAEVLVGSGLLWAVGLAGFAEGEQVQVTSVAKKEKLTESVTASASGKAVVPILYPPKAKGMASVTAIGARGCTVTLDFAIGADALKAR